MLRHPSLLQLSLSLSLRFYFSAPYLQAETNRSNFLQTELKLFVLQTGCPLRELAALQSRYCSVEKDGNRREAVATGRVSEDKNKLMWL